MALSEYQTFATPPLAFPINGKTYALEPLGIAAGLRLAEAITGQDDELNDLKGSALWQLVLGAVWDQMIADGVPLEAATRAGLAALADHQQGRAFAEVIWETGADPKALEKYLTAKAPNRAARRSRSTAAASTTKRRASTSSTKTSPTQ
jgi:hypothetical protein